MNKAERKGAADTVINSLEKNVCNLFVCFKFEFFRIFQSIPNTTIANQLKNGEA